MSARTGAVLTIDVRRERLAARRRILRLVTDRRIARPAPAVRKPGR